jgi:hypothetical protein
MQVSGGKCPTIILHVCRNAGNRERSMLVLGRSTDSVTRVLMVCPVVPWLNTGHMGIWRQWRTTKAAVAVRRSWR